MTGREPVKDWRRIRGIDKKSKFALWMIVAGVFGQFVLLLGLVAGWWK
jgi:hypothetical protein